jgi:pimeloyl-ACP methyl ester carboxylesterase
MNALSRRALLGASLCAGLGLFGGLPRAGKASAYPDPERAGFVAVRGGQVWYRSNGMRHVVDGKLPLLVIHGGPGFSHHYLLALTALADDRPVIFYDQLDSGNSERPGDPANWTVERFVSEVDDVRAALGLDRLIVLGSSWGGTVAAEYAIGRPAGLVGLVLASPLISTPRWIADNTAYRKALPPDVQKMLDEHEAAGTTDSQEYQDAVMVFYRRHLCGRGQSGLRAGQSRPLRHHVGQHRVQRHWHAQGLRRESPAGSDPGADAVHLRRVRRGDACGVRGLRRDGAERAGRGDPGRLAHGVRRAA